MIATQEYGWTQLADRAGLRWPDAADWAMAQAAAAGFDAWEPLVHGPDDLRRVAETAGRHGLAMPSIFLSGPLGGAEAGATLDRMRATLRAAGAMGCRLASVYPSPDASGWKPDAALVAQARNLGALAQAARGEGVQVLYHPEEGCLHHGAREMAHMLLATDPDEVGLCLDPDTVWRASGGSMVAVLDVLRSWGARVAEVHLRQCRAGVWTEALGPGDVDFAAVAGALRAAGARPFVAVEHAFEEGTVVTLDPVEAHRRSLRYVEDAFLPALDG